jgi:5'-nucleotidase/UDP-sugar diphosphatase
VKTTQQVTNIPYLIILVCFAFLSSSALAEERPLTIIHTNDLHSHLLGHSPNKDYSPRELGNDQTLGGWARIATVIGSERGKRNNPVLVLDAGDFLMGTLFHLVSREEAIELGLMKEMGYDATTLGNHEFDFRPDGLARILNTAARKGKIPLVLCANAIFSEEDERDDSLKEVFDRGIVRPFAVLVRDGIRVGLFGLIGQDAVEKAPFASPLKFEDYRLSARRMVKRLKEKEKVDLIICLSHSGLDPDKARSEDEVLAGEVPGIDIIVSGHTHTKLLEPIVVDPTGTIIVQAWAYGRHVGVLDLAVGDGGVRLKDYRAIEVNDTIMGDAEIDDAIGSYIELINQKVLKEHNLTFQQTIAETDFDLTIGARESNLGNMVADALRWYLNRLEDGRSERAGVTMQSNGLISVSDLFRVNPLGIGMDGTPGYPLVSSYLYASEIKKLLEVPATIAPLKSDDYFLHFSGIKVKYNPYRMPFDRVTEISIEDENGGFRPLDFSASNKELYRVTSNLYNASFIKIIGSLTYNILNITPKDKNGNPLTELAEALVDADKELPGLQELKDWRALMEYVRSFDDPDGDGVPKIPERYRGNEGRMVRAPSLKPYDLLAGGNYLTWIAFGTLIGALALIIYVGRVGVKKVSRVRGGKDSRGGSS